MVVSLPFFVVPPDLHETAGFLASNPERDRLVAQLARHVAPEDWIAPVDDAAGIAKRCRHRARLAVAVGPRDQRAARILAAALAAEGVECEILRTRIDGALGLLPEPPEEPAPALVVETKREWLDRCRELYAKDRSLRVAPRPFSSWPEPPRARSPLPRGLGIEDLAWRARLLALVAELWPRSHPRLLAALGAHDLGSNLREDVYAGLGLRERNADLLVNIVEAER